MIFYSRSRILARGTNVEKILTFGSEKACQILSHTSRSTYRSACEGFGTAEAYERAGLIFWGLIGVGVVVIIVFARSISRILD